MIRTILVDDSRAFRQAITAALDAAGGFEIVASVETGEDAVTAALRHRPDLIVMDVVLPGITGLQATAQIMSDVPCAVVVMTSLFDTDAQRIAFEALRAGAVEVLSKPKDLLSAENRQSLVSLLRAMSEVKVVRRRALQPATPGNALVAIGASTGGPPALREVLRHLPGNFAAPVLVAQHLASGFSAGFAQWLAGSLEIDVVRVDKPLPLEPGRVYLAADDHHLIYAEGQVRPLPAQHETAVPSVDRLFSSLLEFPGRVVAGILTGMGRDGADGLARLRSRGHHTLVQDEATSLVYGMPHVAKELGAALEELPLDRIGPRLCVLVGPASAGGAR